MNTPQVTYLQDYTPPSFLIPQIHLTFYLNANKTVVKALLQLTRNPGAPQHMPHLVLDGEALTLNALSLNGDTLPPERYQVAEKKLMILDVPDTFELETTVTINPQANKTLSGLYESNGHFCTQCEPHGFRRITYFIDRPDVMSVYTTTIIADKTRYPVLLSNGNLQAQHDVDAHTHLVTWHDPFKKPAYLFALVAGDLGCVQDTFTTMSRRKVLLEIYVEKGNEDKCQHAMISLQKAMRWDETAFGREYDLDRYMIVAVSYFNMGAMENKGLNIFNDKYILARADIATDDDFAGIEEVVAHEYFHNWTGNRVTCRDWFQLSLKEGLTVFREQAFVTDMHPGGPDRIDNVQYLRTYQFAEDASPMAHAVQPRSYVEINNFYTATVYNKGAEVIRMLQTLLGKAGFRAGMDLYFKHHDGQAVTIEEFIKAMEDANRIDLQQFRLWYAQAGTPILNIATQYDSAAKTYRMTVKQQHLPTPQQAEKKPLHIPFSVGLLNSQGKEFPLQLINDEQLQNTTRVLSLSAPEEVFEFKNINEKPIPSLLRDFSAPVKVNYEYTLEELLFLAAHDQDGFARWEAMQRATMQQILTLVETFKAKSHMDIKVWPSLLAAYRATLEDKHLDAALKAKLISLPSYAYLCEQVDTIEVEALIHARNHLRQAMASSLQDVLLETYQFLHPRTVKAEQDATVVAGRRLKALVLYMLMWTEQPSNYELAFQQYQQAQQMTDRMTALQALSHHDCPQRQAALTDFYQRYTNEPLVIDKWLNLQVNSELPDTFNVAQQLTQHPVFDITNPNRVRAIIGSFAMGNFVHFHRADGKAYAWLADYILQLDKLNPQIAARLVTPFLQWRKFDIARQSLMQTQLKRMHEHATLSNDVKEIVWKSLN